METMRVFVCSRRGNAKSAHRLALSAANFLRQICNGQLDIEAFGVAMPEEYRDVDVRAPRYGVTAMRDTWRRLKDEPHLLPEGVEIPDWPDGPTHWHMFGGWFQGQAGQANLGGNAGRTNDGAGVETTGHELMHNRPFRLLHSNVYTENGEKDEYGDRSGKMGSGAPMSQHVPHHFASGFLGSENEITKVTRNCVMAIVPWETPERSRFDDEFAVVRVGDIEFPDISRSRIYVSTRKTKGYPWRYNRIPTDAQRLWVHAGTSTESFLLELLNPGETCTRVPGVTITYEQEMDESILVRFVFEDDDTPVKWMPGERPLFPPQPGKFPAPGIYWNELVRGQGIDFHVGHEKAALFWYTFTDKGEADWFVAEFENHETLTVPVYTINSGSFNDPSSGVQEQVGVVRIREHGGQVFLDYNTSVHGRGSLSLAHSFTGAVERKVMYNPERNNEGVMVTNLPDGSVIAYWYTFTHRRKRAWFYLHGKGEKLKGYRARGKFIRHNVGEDFLAEEFDATLEQYPFGATLKVRHGDYAIDLDLRKIEALG